MRGTIHLMTAADFLKFRGCLQPSLDAGMRAILKERADALDIPVAAGRRASRTSRQPHTFEDARDHLVSKFPRGDQRAMGYVARMSVAAGAGAERRRAGRTRRRRTFVSADDVAAQARRRVRLAWPVRAALPGRLRAGDREGRTGLDRTGESRAGLCDPRRQARDRRRVQPASRSTICRTPHGPTPTRPRRCGFCPSGTA